MTDLSDTNPTRHGLFDEAILEILARSLPRAARYEPHPRGPWPARAALAEHFGGDPEDYWLTSSTSQAYGWLFSLLGAPGAEVAIPGPGYPLIEPLARFHHLDTVSYRTFYVHPVGWELDRDCLEAVLDREKVRAVVAIHPNNPTGAYAEPAVATVAAERNLPLIADEVFFPFRLAGDQTVRLSGAEAGLTFGLDGLSKLLGAPQLKLAWIRLSGPPAARAATERTLDQIADAYLCVNPATALALPELLTLAEASIARILARVRANLAIAEAAFAPRRVRTVQGGWIALLDVGAILEADALCVALMDRAGLCVHPGYFYDLEDSTLALSLLARETDFRESCLRLGAALAVLNAEQSGAKG